MKSKQPDGRKRHLSLSASLSLSLSLSISLSIPRGLSLSLPVSLSHSLSLPHALCTSMSFPLHLSQFNSIAFSLSRFGVRSDLTNAAELQFHSCYAAALMAEPHPILPRTETGSPLSPCQSVSFTTVARDWEPSCAIHWVCDRNVTG